MRLRTGHNRLVARRYQRVRRTSPLVVRYVGTLTERPLISYRLSSNTKRKEWINENRSRVQDGSDLNIYMCL